jgi:hypothetical protein
MGSIAEVEKVERVTNEDGVPGVDVTCDPGGEERFTAHHIQPVGDDALPLPGDYAETVDAPGAGAEDAVGYVDVRNVGVALPGEKRTYARNLAGEVVCEIWAKRNGDVELRSIAAGGKIILNGAEIDQQGNFTTPGEVTAKAETPAAVKLSTHLHPTGVGPAGPPTPGT